MKQFLITTASGKRLIAKALATHPTITKALKNGTLVIIAEPPTVTLLKKF